MNRDQWLRALAKWGSTKLPSVWLQKSPAFFGVAAKWFTPNERAHVKTNLRLILGDLSERTLDQMVDETYRNFAHCFAEAFAASTERANDFQFEVTGDHHLGKLRERGLIVVTAHVGSWDVAAAAMAKQGFAPAIVMQAESNEKAGDVSDSARKNAGVRVFHVGDDPLSVLPLLKHVKGGGCLALQLDRIPRGMRSQTTDFFGIPWQCPLGPFQLAKAAKVSVVPIFTARRAFLHHYIEVGEPIAFDDDRAAEKAMRAAEGFIRRFPTQWFHFVAHSM